jgi:ABC-2 type transport system ATP-binding protein
MRFITDRQIFMIEVTDLSKHYGTHLALDAVSFSAKQGEILGLLGPNGAGKTTTMRILTGFMPPSEGKAVVAGHDVSEESYEVRQKVGYLPERVPLYPDMTVEGYVTFWAKLRGVRKTKQAVLTALEKVDLIPRRKSLVRNLSKGLKQRLGLAQALVHDPEVLILDEPTIGIDPQQIIEIREQIRNLAQSHTVLFSTHILSEAEQICDRVVILQRGKLVAYGTPEALRKQLYPNDYLYVEVDAPQRDKQKVENLLTALSGVDEVTRLAGGFTVRAKKDNDIRGKLVEKILSSGYGLRELRPVAMTLEDIFLEIVGK